MNERLIKGPSEFVIFLKEAELCGDWDDDITLFIGSYKSMSTACCSGPRDKATRAFLALYRKIVDNKLEGMKGCLLQGARACGFKSIRFEVNENSYYSKGERRNLVAYQRAII
jgi:hypothetical protein